MNVKNNKMIEEKIKPLGDRVLVKPQEAETKTASGIFIPECAKEKPQKGTVIDVGSGSKDEKMVVETGDIILYNKNAGLNVFVGEIEYLIMRQSDIMAIFSKK